MAECIGDIIAERTLTLDGEPCVLVRLARPEPDGRTTYVCRYEIAGLKFGGPRRAYGADAYQALLLALYSVAVVVETSVESKTGRLGPLYASGDFGLRHPDDTPIWRRGSDTATPSDEDASRPQPSVLETLDRWSGMTDAELGDTASPEAIAILLQAVDELLDTNVFVAIDRTTFPQVVRLLAAAKRAGARALGNAIIDAGTQKQSTEFADVMRRFIERSPTRFHREIGQRYLDGRMG